MWRHSGGNVGACSAVDHSAAPYLSPSKNSHIRFEAFTVTECIESSHTIILVSMELQSSVSETFSEVLDCNSVHTSPEKTSLGLLIAFIKNIHYFIIRLIFHIIL
jgi:L-cysteine desulfidase